MVWCLGLWEGQRSAGAARPRVCAWRASWRSSSGCGATRRMTRSGSPQEGEPERVQLHAAL
eukprot:5787631-Pleurochrysis_carterae.AAC.1